VTINTPAGFITQRRDVQTGSSGVVSDYPMRTVYRNTYALPTGLPGNTFMNVIPASAMAEQGGYLLVILANNPELTRYPPLHSSIASSRTDP